MHSQPIVSATPLKIRERRRHLTSIQCRAYPFRRSARRRKLPPWIAQRLRHDGHRPGTVSEQRGARRFRGGLVWRQPVAEPLVRADEGAGVLLVIIDVTGHVPKVTLGETAVGIRP